MDSLTLAIAIAGITSVSGAILGILFVYERDEGDRLAEENTELREALQLRCNEVTDLKSDVGRLSRQIKEQSETLAYREREINTFHKRGYIRNAYGTLQRYSEWFEFGDKKPKRKEKKRVETAIKPHQLKPWMEVLNATDEQKKAIHDACVERGIFVESLATLNVFKNIFFDGSGVRGGAYSDEEDINIPFEEFMARIKGEWVEQESKTKWPA